MDSNIVYLIKSVDPEGMFHVNYDLFPTPKDTILSLRHKLTGGYEIGLNIEPVWNTPDISIFTTTKEAIDINFDEEFGEPEDEFGCVSWFDVSCNPEDFEEGTIQEIDLGRFILENTRIVI